MRGRLVVGRFPIYITQQALIGHLKAYGRDEVARARALSLFHRSDVPNQMALRRNSNSDIVVAIVCRVVFGAAFRLLSESIERKGVERALR